MLKLFNSRLSYYLMIIQTYYLCCISKIGQYTRVVVPPARTQNKTVQAGSYELGSRKRSVISKLSECFKLTECR